MRLNLLTRLLLLSLSSLTVLAGPYAQEDATTLFRRQYLDELIDRDLEFDIELLRRAFGELVDPQQQSKLPALKAHEELPLPAFNPRKYKTTNALTPGVPDHPAEKPAEKQAEKPVSSPILPEIQLLPPLSPGLPEYSEDHYASDKSSGSAASTGKIVDRRKKPARGGRSHAFPHGKRDEDVELAAPLFLNAKLKERYVELEDFFDYYF